MRNASVKVRGVYAPAAGPGAGHKTRGGAAALPCDDDVFDEYIDLVKRVEETCCLSVRRYTSGAFGRHQLGAELAKRRITSEILRPDDRMS